MASGLLNTSRLVGGALGLAVLSTIASGRTKAAGGSPLALTNGFELAFHVAAVIALAGAAIAAFLLREPAASEVVRLKTTEEGGEHEALAA